MHPTTQQRHSEWICPSETEQDLVVLPPMPSAGLLSVENVSQRISLIREMRICRNKENGQRRPNNNLLIKHSQGPLDPQGP